MNSQTMEPNRTKFCSSITLIFCLFWNLAWLLESIMLSYWLKF